MNVALVGNQNSGKTSLFNALTGLNQKVGNWAGVTVERKSGTIKGTALQLIDTPGVYSLNSYTMEEKVTQQYVSSTEVDVIVNIVDATNLERGLYLTTQLLQLDTPLVVALNMYDIVAKRGIKIDVAQLSKQLGVQVVPISAYKKTGIKELIDSLTNASERQGTAIFNVNNCEMSKLDNEQEAALRYDYIVDIVGQVVSKSKVKSTSKSIDKIVLNRWLALPIFAVVMLGVYFLSVGVVGGFTVEFIGSLVEQLSESVSIWLVDLGASEWAISLLVEGIIAGVGAVLNFVPQLIILFLLITLLETTGYMARIAFTFDRLFSKLGLSGKSLIPFIVGSGCSVPGIMATRTIEDTNERLSTVVLTPFIPCSAKLPIIALFSGYFFPNVAGLVSASLYFLAILVIILSAMLMKKFAFKGSSSTFISELPEYKLPNFTYLVKEVASKVLSFIRKAGTIILLASVVIWFSLSFGLTFQYGVDVDNSILALIGKSFSWLFYPMLGTFSWEATVSAIQGLVAKEQVITSMAIIAGLGQDATTGILASSAFSFFSGASAYAFMVFNLFSAPCFGAIGAMKRELGSTKRTVIAITFQTALAFVASYIVFGIGLLIGG